MCLYTDIVTWIWLALVKNLQSFSWKLSFICLVLACVKFLFRIGWVLIKIKQNLVDICLR